MLVHYEGNGTLLDDDIRKFGDVDYTFDLDVERGLSGYIRSPNPYLPGVSTIRLRINDGMHFIAIQLGSGLFNHQRGRYDYPILLAPDQPDDPNNLVRQRPGVPPYKESW
jgi:hypothetical protein